MLPACCNREVNAAGLLQRGKCCRLVAERYMLDSRICYQVIAEYGLLPVQEGCITAEFKTLQDSFIIEQLDKRRQI